MLVGRGSHGSGISDRREKHAFRNQQEVVKEEGAVGSSPKVMLW